MGLLNNIMGLKNEDLRKWVKQERGEFERYGDADKEIAAAKKGNLVKVPKKHAKGFWKNKTNTDAGGIQPGLGGLRKVVEKLKSYGRDKARRRRVYNQVKSNTDDPSILRNNELVAGNSRAMMRQALGLKPKVLQYTMENRQKFQISEDLRKWVRERWVDIGAPKKGGGFKPCGRSKGEKRKGYPKCVPAAKAARMTKGQRRSAVKRKRAAGNPGGKPTMVSTFTKKNKMNEDNLLESYVASYVNLAYILEAKLCPKGKAAAKRKFKVYPSAYANMYASAVCSGKVTPGGKKK